jgi:hypothetical protein
MATIFTNLHLQQQKLRFKGFNNYKNIFSGYFSSYAWLLPWPTTIITIKISKCIIKDKIAFAFDLCIIECNRTCSG